MLFTARPMPAHGYGGLWRLWLARSTSAQPRLGSARLKATWPMAALAKQGWEGEGRGGLSHSASSSALSSTATAHSSPTAVAALLGSACRGWARLGSARQQRSEGPSEWLQDSIGSWPVQACLSVLMFVRLLVYRAKPPCFVLIVGLKGELWGHTGQSRVERGEVARHGRG